GPHVLLDPLHHRPEARLPQDPREAPQAVRRAHPHLRVRGSAARAQDRLLLRSARLQHARGIRAHRDHRGHEREPARIQQARDGALKTMSELVSQVVVIGDRRKYVSVVVTVAEDQAKKIAAAAGEPAGTYAEAARSDAVRVKIQAAVDQLNSTLASYETIKRF